MNEIYNREISWLEFNDRVLQEAQDRRVPLVQRLRFLGIFSNNQDEFIKVRIANLIRYSAMKGSLQPVMTAGYAPADLLPILNNKIKTSQELFRNTYRDIIKEMEGEGIYVVDNTALSQEQLEFCRNYYLSVLSVRLVPIIIRKREKLPFLPDGKTYLAVKMTSEKSVRFAVLQVPVSDASPRFVVLPSEQGRTDIIFVDDIIRLFLDDIFFMFSYDSISAYTFKIIRDAEFIIDDNVSMSISQKMSLGISGREKGRPIRLIYDYEMPVDLLATISKKFGFKSSDQTDAGGKYHLMRDLMRFPKVHQDLESRNPKPLIHPRVDPFDSILKVIRKQDLLLCYPYHTFNHMIDFLREAAIDPRVQSIAITLYRTANNSKVINALLNGAKNGKRVTALVELKARFDEEHNISTVDILQSGGVKVITSQETLKVHSKLVLVERQEAASLKGYVYVGTGNFNESTSLIYSDFGLLTANPDIANDARKVFNYLENPHNHPVFKELLVSPYYLREEIESLIMGEIKNAKNGKKASIRGKFNSLTDIKMIKLLYKASQAGVKVKLIVRGTCCLRAGVKGLSENIEVRSIVDKYLEHARMFVCHNSGKSMTYIMSADLMTRNLDRRVEVGVRIYDKQIEKTLHKYFDIQWRDNEKARIIAAPYDNRYVERCDDGALHRSQVELFEAFEAGQL
ncbi:MAG: polyphosphate kinase 1 [Rikenellaceae bacterium]